MAHFWEEAFRALPVPPLAITTARSSQYSPPETVRRQECRLLGAMRRVWPEARLRSADHFEKWHQECDAASGVADWPLEIRGSFGKHALRTKDLWELNELGDQLNCPKKLPKEDQDVEVTIANSASASGRIQLLWRAGSADGGKDADLEDFGALDAGKELVLDSTPGYVWVARCAEDGSPKKQQRYTVPPEESGPARWDVKLHSCAGSGVKKSESKRWDDEL